MDALGFAFATALLVTVVTIFGTISRIVSGVASEIPWTLVPSMVDGFRAWGGERPAITRSPDDGMSPDDVDGPDGTRRGREADAATDRHDPGVEVPVQAVSRPGWHLFGSPAWSPAVA